MSQKSIAVLTLNPGIDRVIYLGEGLCVGGHNRSTRAVVSQGSKGANQAIMLSNLGHTVDYFSFGDPDPFLKRDGIVGHYTPTECGARLNIKVVEPNGRGTELNEPGGPIKMSELDALLSSLTSQKYDVVSLCGSFPHGVENNVYKLLIKMLKDRESVTVLDASGEALSLGASACPTLIKPNRAELGAFGYGVPDTWKTAVEICGKVHGKFGCEVICTLDEDGSVYVGREGKYRVTTAPTVLCGFSGAGDSYLASYISARYLDGADVPTALHRAAAAATAKIALEGTTIPTREQVDSAMSAVEVKYLADGKM